jgi:subtilisin family serine protease
MGKQEIVAVTRAGAGLGLAEAVVVNVLEGVLAQHGATMRPVFPDSFAASTAEAPQADAPQDAMAMEQSRYFTVDAPEAEEEAVAQRLRETDLFETVYVKPAVENPLAPDHPPSARPAARLELPMPANPAPATPASAIPDFSPRQGYLNAAPDGVDARYAWSLPGGRGAGLRIVDIEGGWQFTHVDLRQNNGGLIAGQAYPNRSWRDHGTAVLGEIGGDDNNAGVAGIAPQAMLSAVSHRDIGSAGAISKAAGLLGAGDILLLEMHRPGPRHAFQNRPDQAGYIAVEWWPDDFLAIRAAVRRGIVVVEAAGNGAENLNDALYDAKPAQFPASWSNPFGGGRDSGAIVVGAGAPAGGAFGPARSRLDFSNHGRRVDCQGWGRGVVTTGYGDLHRSATLPSDEDQLFTAIFSGTSSASPIVTGAVACLLGIAKVRGIQLSPDAVRTLLRNHGTPQQASATAPVSQRIGNLPDLRQLIARLLAVA